MAMAWRARFGTAPLSDAAHIPVARSRHFSADLRLSCQFTGRQWLGTARCDPSDRDSQALRARAKLALVRARFEVRPRGCYQHFAFS